MLLLQFWGTQPNATQLSPMLLLMLLLALWANGSSPQQQRQGSGPKP